MMGKPTCDELAEGTGFASVSREADDSWGSYVLEVFHRIADDTYWQAEYRLSTDGETNELCEGQALITQVKAEQQTVTVYRPVNSPSSGV
jgi:hypothetical protein